VLFFVGLHQPSDAKRIGRCMISVNRLYRRKPPLSVGAWIMDSGAFTEISTHGRWRFPPEKYASEILRWSDQGRLEAAVTQDFMCEDMILKRCGMDVRSHQHLTVWRYQQLLKLLPDRVYLMPVLQGFQPKEYAENILHYGTLLSPGAWVGVGSVCKRNANPDAILDVLDAVLQDRPDLRLHGFGLKLTALADPRIRSRLWSADSMAWSLSARKEGRSPNDWKEARGFQARIDAMDNPAGELPAVESHPGDA
jgi:hypothetical protein